MPLREQIIDAQGRAYATGRRKDAVARVWIKPGTGKITINGRDQEVYFARPTLRLVINQVFGVAERDGQYDVVCTVKGGGLSGQAGAVKHGIGQALTKLRADPARAGQGRRLPDPRQPHRRAQEVRPRQGAPQLPVLEALSEPSASYSGLVARPTAGGSGETGRPFSSTPLAKPARSRTAPACAFATSSCWSPFA